ncbi:hypothetical protein [Streptomyces sp. URMC 129]|uniref:hypothetical protein n=1 Tax=Streptomyces sp. URMC 129 TaxID=3423407 RepID=UPI003F1D4687
MKKLSRWEAWRLSVEMWWHLHFLWSWPVLLVSPRRRRIRRESARRSADPRFAEEGRAAIVAAVALKRLAETPEDELLARIFTDDTDDTGEHD